MVYAQVRITTRDETYYVVRDFEIQTDHLIPARKLDTVLINR